MQVIKYLKRAIKWLLIFIAGIFGIIGILVGITIINTYWRTDKFRFENFQTAEELITYIRSNFPDGSDSKPLLDLLSSAGAECQIIFEKYYSKEDREIGTHLLYDCTYNVGWLHAEALTEYKVMLWIDKNQKMLKFAVGREYAGL